MAASEGAYDLLFAHVTKGYKIYSYNLSKGMKN